MNTIFSREFQSINESFGQTFQELFGGGRATLELEDPDDILNCGIEIKVQPPGKALKSCPSCPAERRPSWPSPCTSPF